MRILVVNSGSSSIKYSVFQSEDGREEPVCRVDGEIAGVGASDATLTIRIEAGEKRTSTVSAPDAESAMHTVLDALEESGFAAMDAVGYRVVHPGARLNAHVRIDASVLRALEEAAQFAPLHDPVVVKIIHEMMERLPSIAHYACFDTVFHETMPEQAKVYALPERYRAAGVRRYGFHGLSCESIVRRARLQHGEFPRRVAIAHLGSGCSITALVEGHSIDNTMGLTPDGGVVMGTRPGDLDPGVVLYLLRHGDMDGLDGTERMLNHDAGTVALSGLKNDLRVVRAAAAEGDGAARLALAVFSRSIRKAIGGYAWLMGGLDAIFFSGGIGEHDQATRADIMGGLEELGVELKEQDGVGLHCVSTPESRTAVWVIPAEEDLMIAIHVIQLAREYNGNLEAGDQS